MCIAIYKGPVTQFRFLEWPLVKNNCPPLIYSVTTRFPQFPLASPPNSPPFHHGANCFPTVFIFIFCLSISQAAVAASQPPGTSYFTSSSSSSSLPRPAAPPNEAVPPPPPLAARREPEPLPENRAANANLQMNAQGGAVLNDDELNHDWLDWLYTVVRAGVLLGIIYFYSTFSRLVMVVGALLLLYL